MAQRQQTLSESEKMADALNRVVFAANPQLFSDLRQRLESMGNRDQVALIDMAQRQPNLANLTLLFDFLNRTSQLTGEERQSLARSIAEGGRTREYLFTSLPPSVQQFVNEHYFRYDCGGALTGFLDDCATRGMSPQQIRKVLEAATAGPASLRLNNLREALGSFAQALESQHGSTLFLSRFCQMSADEQESMQRHAASIEAVRSRRPLTRQ